MRGMNSESVDLIYLDPPFNSKANYAAPIGSQAAGAEFKDTWTLQDVDIAWLDLIEAKHPNLWRVVQAAMTDSDKSYLVYMATRLLEMHRLLKPTGSVYLHCDPTMSHYLKLMMDAVFGRQAFRNEVAWCYDTAGRARRYWNRKHDVLLWFSKGGNWKFNADDVRMPRRNRTEGWESWYRLVDEDGRRYQIDGKGYRYYADASRLANDWWEDIPALHAHRDKERVGYPTQKPLALLERIIKASSNEGDIVLDPFCGCATTCVAADAHKRIWVGIDISAKAAKLVKDRIDDWTREIIHRDDIPKRTDIKQVLKYNHVKNKTKLYGEQRGQCKGCDKHFQHQNLTVDHITPKSKGGTDHLENLQLLCGHCNSLKGNRGMEYLIARLREIGHVNYHLRP